MAASRKVDGLPFPASFPEENYYLMRDLTLREGDIILSAYPKCGSNWLAYILWSILYPETTAPSAETVSSDIVFVDCSGLGRWSECSEVQGRTLSTHLPLDRLPKSECAKYITIIRNPFDCIVSYYHYVRNFPRSPYAGQEGREIPTSLLDDFVNGNFAFGDFFKHVKSSYELRNEPNVHLLIYEQMKANPRKEILGLAKFLGHEKMLEANGGKLLKKIVEQTSFSVMKENLKYTSPVDKAKVIPLLREGKTGGYGESLTIDQISTLTDLMDKELAGTELLQLWQSI